MTREQAKQRKQQLELRRMALVDQLTEADAASASISSAGGSQSYTNRTVADLKSKINFIDKEIARIDAGLGKRPPPNSIISIEPKYVR